MHFPHKFSEQLKQFTSNKHKWPKRSKEQENEHIRKSHKLGEKKNKHNERNDWKTLREK